MKFMRKSPFGWGILAVSLILIFTLVGCEKGTLGLKGGSIAGSVLDSESLAGIPSVYITAVAGESETDKVTKYGNTDSQGNYYFNNMRAGEWTLSFDKAGYSPISADASQSVKVVVENNEHRSVPEVRMTRTYVNQYINVKGTLVDATNGTQINLGTAQFTFGKATLNNRLPTELQTGFSVPAVDGDMGVYISVTNYAPYEGVIPGAFTDRDLGTIKLSPRTYKVVGVWKDVPGWVFANNPNARIVAYAGNRVVATASASLGQQSFEIDGIPIGTSISLTAEIPGYRMNGAIPIVPNADFQGTIYQTLSLKNNFAQIMRDVRVILNGTSISNNDRVGAFCKETGTTWPTTVVTGGVFAAPQVVDLGVNQVPTGYELNFTGFIIDDGIIGNESERINDDGTDPQIVTISL